MSITDSIQADMKAAARARDAQKLVTLRMLSASLHNAKIEKKESLNDEDVVRVLQREAKKRSEAAQAFDSGERSELAEKERTELTLIQKYLPAQLSKEQVALAVTEVLATMENPVFGTVMKKVMHKLTGQADGKLVSEVVKERLAPSP